MNPVNFNKEVTLEFNLGPQHLMENFVSEVYERRKKEYIYKEDERGILVTRARRLGDTSVGSSIRYFRKHQEDASKFPLDFWK